MPAYRAIVKAIQALSLVRMPYALSRTDGLDRMYVLHHCRYFASMMMVMDRARIVSAYTVLFSGTLCTSTP